MTTVKVVRDENALEAKESTASLRMNHTCWSLQPHHPWLVTLLALTSRCVPVQAVDSDQPRTHRKWQAVWMLQAVKRQSQAAGKAPARSQSAFSGWRSICRKWWKCCDWCHPGKHWIYLKDPLDQTLWHKWRGIGIYVQSASMCFFFFLAWLKH